MTTSTYIPAPARYAGLWRPDTPYAAGTLVHYGEGGLYAATAPIPKLHRYLEDTFQRHQRNGWGAGWQFVLTPDANKPAFSVVPGCGLVTFGADGSLDGARNSQGWFTFGQDVPQEPVDVLMHFSFDSVANSVNSGNASGGWTVVLGSDTGWDFAAPEFDWGWYPQAETYQWDGSLYAYGVHDFGYASAAVGATDPPVILAHTRYVLRLRRVADTYSYKVWAQADPEPSDWTLTWTNAGADDDPGHRVLFSWFGGTAPHQVYRVYYVGVLDVPLTPDADARWEVLP